LENLLKKLVCLCEFLSVSLGVRLVEIEPEPPAESSKKPLTDLAFCSKQRTSPQRITQLTPTGGSYMSKYLLRSVMALSITAVALAFAAPVRGQETAKPEKPKKHQFTGVIESVDAAAGTVAVKQNQESKMFKVGAKTKYSTADKKDAAIGDLKAGEKVLVSYTEDGSTLTALKIGPPAPSKKKSEEK
jgi:Cu/Ag efflux protein CusF